MKQPTLPKTFLGSNCRQILENARVAIIGLSGGGSHVVQQLAHVGVGDFLLVDHDRVELSNLNRLVGATLQDADLSTPKTAVMEGIIRRLRPSAKLSSSATRWQECAELLRDRDVIFGCVDKFSERQQLEAAARRYLIPYIDLGMDVHPIQGGFTIGGQVAVSMPGQPCLQCLGIVTEDRLQREGAMYGSAGNSPQVVWANGVLASTAVGLFVQLLCPWRDPAQFTILREYDGDFHAITSSNKMTHLQNRECDHFSDLLSIGDPFYKPSFARSIAVIATG